MASDPHELLSMFLDDHVPGAAVAVVRSGTPVLTYCHGMADIEWRQPITPTTVFRLASLSKPFTALTILLLADDGLLDLDGPITEYFPNHPTHWQRITVRHLLTHTSGIPNFQQPGNRYSHSNAGYRLLDMIAAEVSGTKFAELLAERVFRPAGMVDSRLLTDEDIVPERANGYRRTERGFANAPHLSQPQGGACGIGSTLADLLRFDAALRHGAFADARLHERMFTPVRLACGRTEGYGLGWSLSTYRGRHVKHHAGDLDGFSCGYLRIPEEDTSLITLTNLEGFPCATLARRLIDRTLNLPRTEPEPIDLPQSALDGRTGTYTDFTVTSASGRLLVTENGNTHRMLPINKTTYVDEDDADVTLAFHDNDPSEAATLTFPLSWRTGYRSVSIC